MREIDLFALHYVFIPRLNLQLSRFVEGRNNHSLRTEHGLSPKQLWTRLLCIVSDVNLRSMEYTLMQVMNLMLAQLSFQKALSNLLLHKSAI